MSFQIFNDGACIRIESGTKTLLVTKEQVKTIDTIQNNIVRIDIGEGPLKNIFINYQDVTTPVVGSASALRDVIKGMLLSDLYTTGDATEAGQVNILSQLTNIAGILSDIKKKESDLTRTEPSRVDESSPHVIYRGWHKASGNGSENEWAIQRIRRQDDVVLYEWAFGTQNQNYSWDNRANHTYIPLSYITLVMEDGFLTAP